MRFRQLERQQGFTLLELLTVLAILVMVMGMLAVGFSRAMRTRHINSAARSVSIHLQLGRRLAAARNRIAHVRFVSASAEQQMVEIYLFEGATSLLGSVPAARYDSATESERGPSVKIVNGVRLGQNYGAVYFWPDGSAGQATDGGAGETSPFPEIDLVDSDDQHRYIRVFQATGLVETRNPDVE